MRLDIDPVLDTALRKLAGQFGLSPEAMAVDILRRRLLPPDPLPAHLRPRDEWERRLFGAAVNCGLSLPPGVPSSEDIYD